MSQLYSNWNYILDNEIDDLCLDLCFTLTKENEETSTLDVIELVEDGKNIEVTDENKKMYVDLWYVPSHSALTHSAKRK